ncbi:4-fold beta flower protein [Truepera radiovictrix]
MLYDRAGAPQLYLTGAGVLYTLSNEPVGFVHGELVASPRGEPLGWFDGAFLWDVRGELLGFVKGASAPAGFALPTPQPLRVRPQPTPASLHPLLLSLPKPPLRWCWSEQGLADLFVRSA